jgi:hypothetical protein
MDFISTNPGPGHFNTFGIVSSYINHPNNFHFTFIDAETAFIKGLIDNLETVKWTSFMFLGDDLKNVEHVDYMNDEVLIMLRDKDLEKLGIECEEKDIHGTMFLWMKFDSMYEDIKSNKKRISIDEAVIYYEQSNLNRIDVNKFVRLFSSKTGSRKVKKDRKSYINLVVEENGHLHLQEFNIKNPKINVNLAYGEKFAEDEKKILNSIRKDDKGLYIFHGEPGTGKSMWIRNLIRKINSMNFDGEVIYMPSEMVGSLESPAFIPFISQHPDSILVIEDADIALQSRKNHGSIVKTILNMTDGILADCLRLKIIATFNCALNEIDTALLRKGRLTHRHEFKPLNREQAIALGEWLKIPVELFDKDEYRNKKDWTLAEIYNISIDFHWEKNQKRMGFGI